jgi:hypothetical protein
MAHPVPDIHPEQVGKRKKPGPLAGPGFVSLEPHSDGIGTGL